MNAEELAAKDRIAMRFAGTGFVTEFRDGGVLFAEADIERLLARLAGPAAYETLACSCVWACTESCDTGPHVPGDD